MNKTEQTKDIVVNGVTLGQMIKVDNRVSVKGLPETWFKSEGEATRAVATRHERAMKLAQERREKLRRVNVRLGNGLYEAIVAQGLWVGRPVETSKTQTTLEVEDVELLETGLLTVIETLEAQAKQRTRNEPGSMKARAVIGAAKQQLHRLSPA
jgi:hypothetical protein